MSIERQASFLKCRARRGHRSNTHDLRLNSRIRPTYDSTHRREISLLHKLLAGDNERGRAIDDSGSIARRDKSILCKCRSQFGQSFERRFRPQMIVVLEQRDTAFRVFTSTGTISSAK